MQGRSNNGFQVARKPPQIKSLLTKMGRAPNWNQGALPIFSATSTWLCNQSSATQALWLCPSVFKFLHKQRGPRPRPLVSCFSISQTQEVEALAQLDSGSRNLDLPQSQPHETSQLSLTFCFMFCFMFAVLMLASYKYSLARLGAACRTFLSWK